MRLIARRRITDETNMDAQEWTAVIDVIGGCLGWVDTVSMDFKDYNGSYR